jgi:hypothetical protein
MGMPVSFEKKGNIETDTANLKNPYRHTALYCCSIIILGIVMIILPGIIGLDGFSGGFALSFFGFFVAIVGIITVIIFARLARLASAILEKQNILVHWTYTPEEWKTYSDEEHTDDSSDKRSLFLLVAVIAIIVGIGMGIVYHDFLLIFYIIAGIIAVIGLTAYLSTALPYHWNRTHLGDVYIAREGVYLNRRLHIWKGLGTGLGNITYEEGKHFLPRIIIEYSSPNYLTRNYYTARIPVPPGQEENARKIVNEMSSPR